MASRACGAITLLRSKRRSFYCIVRGHISSVPLAGGKSWNYQHADCRFVHVRPQHDQHIGLIIDGDRFGPSSWPLALASLSTVGTIAHAYVVAAPAYGQKDAWKDAMASHNIQFIPVPRRVGGTKDPNDIAIAFEASRLVIQNNLKIIALLVSDADFVYLAERLQSSGCRTIALLREGSKAGLASAFEERGAQVMWFAAENRTEHQPKMKAVLHKDGESSFEHISGTENMSFDSDVKQIGNVLTTLNYLDSIDDPLVPAIAKFYHANAIGSLIVWPDRCPRNEVRSVIGEQNPRTWRSNPKDIAFVFPRGQGKATKADMLKYGSTACKEVISGGGPFIMRDSDMLVLNVFRRLGYLDDALNDDVAEAVELFCENSMNQYNLRSIGVQISSIPGLNAQLALLRGVLLSPKLHGTWHLAPRDASVRQYFLSCKLIRRLDAPEAEVHAALQLYVRRHGICARRTYNGLVTQALAHLNKDDPSRRR